MSDDVEYDDQLILIIDYETLIIRKVSGRVSKNFLLDSIVGLHIRFDK